MTRDFAADVRLLEDVHRLQQLRVIKPDGRGECFDFLICVRSQSNTGSRS